MRRKIIINLIVIVFFPLCLSAQSTEVLKEVERGDLLREAYRFDESYQAYQSAMDMMEDVAETAVKAAAGRVPVFVGAMDNSIKRAKARIASMEHLDVTAFVLTTPYYEVDTADQVMKYFREVAKSTKHNVMLYDLAVVTNFKITYDMVCQLKKDIPNLLGIKSGDLVLQRKIRLNPELAGMQTFFSNLDVFDIAFPWGVGCVLDGMFTCTPVNSRKLIEAMRAGDKAGAAEALNNIIDFRDKLLGWDLWPA
jgi:4-hydroxy-tetrahydrodipicolinate synthase